MQVSGPTAYVRCRTAVLLSVFFLAIIISGWAQSDVNEVHITPHTKTISSFAPEPAIRSAPTYRSNVNLVLVNVTVLDHAQRSVSGLSVQDFALVEDKHPQAIKYFSSDDQPLSLSIVLDASSSMGPRMEQARRAVLELVRTSNPLDDLSLVVVGDTPKLALDFTDDIGLRSTPPPPKDDASVGVPGGQAGRRLSG